jgi:hypothetical protein
MSTAKSNDPRELPARMNNDKLVDAARKVMADRKADQRRLDFYEQNYTRFCKVYHDGGTHWTYRLSERSSKGVVKGTLREIIDAAIAAEGQ